MSLRFSKDQRIFPDANRSMIFLQLNCERHESAAYKKLLRMDGTTENETHVVVQKSYENESLRCCCSSQHVVGSSVTSPNVNHLMIIIKQIISTS